MRISSFGYIYVIRLLDSQYMFTTNSKRGCSYKIGKSRDADIRTKALHVLMPYPTEVMTVFPAMDMHWVERYVHETLADVRVHGEWFALRRPQMEWLIVLGSPYIDFQFDEDNRKALDSSYMFYAERLHYDPE